MFARPDDLVCVLSRVDNQFLQFLSNLGVSPKDGNVIVALNDVHPNYGANLSDILTCDYEGLLNIRKMVKRNKKVVLNPYMLTPGDFKLAAVLETVLGRKVHILGGNPDIVDYANHKHNVRAKALELGVPVPDGDIVEIELQENRRPLDLTPIKAAVIRYIHKTGRVIVKGSRGFAGSSITIVENNPKSIQKALKKIAQRIDNRIYLVETMLNAIVSPNIIMHIEPDNGRILCVSVTDQILSDNLAHEGNICPSSVKTLKDMLLSAEKLSRWLQAEGYCGVVGFDFGEYFNPETREFKHFLAEVNPRINSSVYPKFLMEHLNREQEQKGRPCIEVFYSTNIKTKASSFNELSKLYGHLFFKPETGKGLVPFNIGCLERGKFTLAVFGKSKNEVMEMYEDFKTLSTKE